MVLAVLLGSVLLPQTSSYQTVDFDWDDVPDRTWIGEDWWANAIQDWRVEGGRVQCVEGRSNFPLRTAQLLTAYLGSTPGSFSIYVTVGTGDGSSLAEGGLAGVIFGHGGDDVDHRISSLVHHKPAEDGGMLAVIDHAGRVHLRDFSTPVEGGYSWSLSGATSLDLMPEYEPFHEAHVEKTEFKPLRISIDVSPNGNSYDVRLSASEIATGGVVSVAWYEGIPAHQVEGGIGLVSHLAPDSGAAVWFDDLSVRGFKVKTSGSRAFGPIISAMHTVSAGKMKMTVQMPPLGNGDRQTAQLEIMLGRNLVVADTALMDRDSSTFRFSVDNWDASRDTPYRVMYAGREAWKGTIRAEPKDEEFVIAAFTGHKTFVGPLRWNSTGIWTPHQEIIEGVGYHDVDFLFFSGDQIYEGDLTPARRNPPEDVYLDYLHKWYRFLWAYRDLMRDIPTVCLPDDHDVYHGNIWGAGGRQAVAQDGMTAQDSGGYTLAAATVNAIHRSQVSHLPDPFDPTPIEQGISVYYTSIRYGGVSFAVIGDRMFKDSPTPTVPDGRFKNGWPLAEGYDARDADVPGAVLLGGRQEAFLSDWADDWSGGTWMKVLLSQTPFANVATLPASAKNDGVVPRLPIYAVGEYPPDDRPASDGDSNGWPQTPRDRAVRTIRKAFALHISGDQHLASVVQYGVDEWRDAGYSFCVPAVGNTWPRRWMPSAAGLNQVPGAPRYTGDYFDGFGNLMTVWAVANPYQTGQQPSNLYDRVPGYGIVRLFRSTRDITMECWPRWVAQPAANAEQYRGWPITINQLDNYARQRYGYLPPIVSARADDPVVRVVNESTGEVLYTVRIIGRSIRPWVFEDGTYTVWFGEPGTSSWTRIRGLRPTVE